MRRLSPKILYSTLCEGCIGGIQGFGREKVILRVANPLNIPFETL
jgi:hypothetical protein